MISTPTRNRHHGRSNRRFGLVFTLLVAAAALSPVFARAQDEPLKIAVVDLEFIVAASPAGQELQKKLESFTESVNAEVKAKQDAAAGIRQRIADGANTLSEEALTRLQQEFEDAGIAIKRLRDDRTREGQKMQADGLRQIEEQLKPVFEAITEERGYDLILNNVPGVIVMAGPRADITQVVLDRLGGDGG